MAKKELRIYHRISMIVGLLIGLSACAADNGSVGMTLRFISIGHEVGVRTFQPEGGRNMAPGVVGGGERSGKEMAFMPGDAKGGMPVWVDVEWVVESQELRQRMDHELYTRPDKFSPEWAKDYEKFMAQVPHYSRRIDLRPVITPELLAAVRADRHNTQLKLTFTFNNDKLDVKAAAYKWR